MAAGMKQISSHVFFSLKQSKFLINNSSVLFIVPSSTISKDKKATKRKRKASGEKTLLSTSALPSISPEISPSITSTAKKTKTERTKKSTTSPLSTSDTVSSSPTKKRRTKKDSSLDSTKTSTKDPSTKVSTKVSKRCKAPVASSTDTIDDRPPPSNYPFYGLDTSTTDNGDMYTSTHSGHDTNSNTDVDEYLGKRDTPDGRYYHFQSTHSSIKEVYKFPSVTTVLDQTRPRSSWFSLRNWRRSMIEEMGEEEFKKWKQNVINVGKSFHSYLEFKLKDKTKTITKTSCLSSSYTPSDYVPSLLSSSKPHSPQPLSYLSITPSPSPPSLSLSYSPLFPHTNTIIPAYQDYQTITDFLCSLSDCYTNLSSCLPSSLLQSSFNSKSLNNYRYLESIKDVLGDMSDVIVTEGVVTHKELGYSGTVDCVAKYKDSICLIDWKTSFKQKPTLDTLYDYPLQTVAYAGAINSSSQYPFKVDNILIVVAYSTGFPAHAHFLDSTQCHTYWKVWLDRLNQYHTLFAHDLSTVL